MTAPNVPHTPSKPVNHGAATTGSQRDRRFTDTLYDTHKHPVRFPQGRPFTGQREFTSGTQTESITAGFITSDLQCGAYYCESPEMGQTPQERMDTLASAWQAPWIPLPKYFRFNYRAKRITFAYDKMITDEREGLTRYWEAAVKMAAESEIDPDRNIVPGKVKVVLGLPSQFTNKIRLAQAAQAGDPWLLGFVDEPNVELAKLLGRRISFIGGHSSDRDYTESAIAAEPKPLATPEQVLGFSPAQVQEMIAAAIAQHEAAKKAEHAAKSAAGKKAKAEKAA
jgi:hypothetical protein